MRKLCLKFGFMVVCSSALAAEVLQFPTTPPTEPKDAAKTFHVLDGFTMQLIAAEPLVTDPVAITYDEDGRAYVCEMNDYPYTDKATHKPSQENPTDLPLGKVRLLTDTNDDGVFDKATVFAEGLSWPTGAACWKGGVFVTATPDVWYLKDTNGDGVADVRQKVFTGFKKLNVQAVMNNPIWGLDHRIYVAGGSNGGEIQRAPGSESVLPLPKDFKPLPMKRHDFSFDPSTGDVRLESGGARFGNTFDDWGNRFLCNIRNPCQHVVLPYRYLERNPYLVIPSALNDCAEAGDQLPVYRTSPPEPWREFRAKRWVQEGSHLPKSELVGAGVVTSSAGITVYRGDAYPPEYRDFAFVADVAGNLFYRMKLVPDGVTFKAVQVDGTKNFCTSDDLWCRPVNFVNAPDGCLHVCDMYREVIEHPWSIPDDIHAVVDLLRGRDRGRLYRLAPKSFKPRATPKLGAARADELVVLLDHSNGWHRETAQRLLYERQDKTIVEPLRSCAREAKTSLGKVGALWALAGLHALGKKHPGTLGGSSDTLVKQQGDGTPLLEAMKDIDAHVREHAVILAQGPVTYPQPAQTQADNSGFGQASMEASPPWLQIDYRLQKLVKDESMRVRVETVETSRDYIQGFGGSSVQHTAGIVFPVDGNNAWARARLISASGKIASTQILPNMIRHRLDNRGHIGPEMIRDLCDLAVRLKDSFALNTALGDLDREQPNWEITIEILACIGASMQTSGWHWKDVPMSEKGSFWPSDKPAAFLARARKELVRRVPDANLSLAARVQCVAALAPMVSLNELKPVILPLLAPSQPAELQLAGLESLGSYREPAVVDILIESWPILTPMLREKATSLMLSRTDSITALLNAIEAKQITPAQLSAAAKATLGRQKNPVLAERIAKLVGDGGSSNRKEVIAKYEAVMTLSGDAALGAKTYEAACMVCHRHKDRGNDVGPNLGTIRGWTAEQIITNVLDPNREVSPNFALYIVETNDGRTLTGLISGETGGNLTLKRADGGTDTVLRSEIKSLTSPGISLMPEGLEAAITPEQMADLIAYLKGG